MRTEENPPPEICACGVPQEIHHNTACGWEYAALPFMPFETINLNMSVKEKIERWAKWNMYWDSYNALDQTAALKKEVEELKHKVEMMNEDIAEEKTEWQEQQKIVQAQQSEIARLREALEALTKAVNKKCPTLNMGEKTDTDLYMAYHDALLTLQNQAG